MHRRGALPVRGAEAVGAGVAAADDDHLLARRGDRRLGQVALLHAVGPGQVLHRLVDPAEFATGNREIARRGGAAGQHDGVVAAAQLVDAEVDADVHAGAEVGAFGPHLVEALVEMALLHLELGDAVAEQPADPIGPLVDDHLVAGARELLRGGQTGRARADDRDALAGADRRRQRT